LTVDDAMPHGNKNKRQSLDHEFFLNSLYFCVKFVFGLAKSDGVGTFCNDLNCQLLQLATYPWGSPWRGKGSINKKLSVLLRCHPPDFSRRSMPQRRSKKWRGYPKLVSHSFVTPGRTSSSRAIQFFDCRNAKPSRNCCGSQFDSEFPCWLSFILTFDEATSATKVRLIRSYCII
jgi:hypothetical protein